MVRARLVTVDVIRKGLRFRKRNRLLDALGRVELCQSELAAIWQQDERLSAFRGFDFQNDRLLGGFLDQFESVFRDHITVRLLA